MIKVRHVPPPFNDDQRSRLLERSDALDCATSHAHLKNTKNQFLIRKLNFSIKKIPKNSLKIQNNSEKIPKN